MHQNFDCNNPTGSITLPTSPLGLNGKKINTVILREMQPLGVGRWLCPPSTLITGWKGPISFNRPGRPPAGVGAKQSVQEHQWHLRETQRSACCVPPPFPGGAGAEPVLQAEEGAAAKKMNGTPCPHGVSILCSIATLSHLTCEFTYSRRCILWGQGIGSIQQRVFYFSINCFSDWK